MSEFLALKQKYCWQMVHHYLPRGVALVVQCHGERDVGSRAFAADSNARPNIVFILADDLGYRELGSFGQQLIRTPNLDRLASQGVKLTQHYCGNAVCAPSRCVLMTGRHPGHSYVRSNRSTPMFNAPGSDQKESHYRQDCASVPATR